MNSQTTLPTTVDLSPEPQSTFKPYTLICLGKAALICEGKEINVGSRKILAMLAYLSTKEGGSESRERLAGLLWGDFSEEKARASLRQAISELKQKLPEGLTALVHADRLDVKLNSDLLRCDAIEIREQANFGAIPTLLLQSKYVSETFLIGLDDLDPGFRNWLSIYRQSLHDYLVRSLESRLQTEQSSAVQKDIGIALLNLDETHEPACRTAMLALAQSGNSSAALRLYNELWKKLEDEFDAEPTKETQNLVAEIKLNVFHNRNEQSHHPVEFLDDESYSPLALANPHRKVDATGHYSLKRLTLRILEFDEVAVNESSKSIVTVFRNELMASLSRFRDWRVFDDTQAGKSQFTSGFSIGATYYREGSAIRFVLKLTDGETGQLLWTERFGLEPQFWFQTQQKIIRRIAVALDVNMTNDRLNRVVNVPDLSLDLFDRWLRGQQHIFRWQMEDEEKAEKLFRSVVDEAPDFAPAYSGLAGILNARHLIFPGQFRSRDTQETALEFAQKAVALDPLDSRTQHHLAWSLALNGEFQKATTYFHLAVELNSDDPWTLVSAAEGLALCGDLRSSSKLEKLAQEIGFGYSDLHWSYQTSIAFIHGNYLDCVRAAENCDMLLNCAGAWRSAALALLGNYRDAEQIGAELCGRIRDNWHAEQEPTDWEITRWLLQCFPIAKADVHQKFEAGLRLAGFRAGDGGQGSDSSGQQSYRQPRIE